MSAKLSETGRAYTISTAPIAAANATRKRETPQIAVLAEIEEAIETWLNTRHGQQPHLRPTVLHQVIKRIGIGHVYAEQITGWLRKSVEGIVLPRDVNTACSNLLARLEATDRAGSRNGNGKAPVTPTNGHRPEPKQVSFDAEPPTKLARISTRRRHGRIRNYKRIWSSARSDTTQ